MQLTGARASLSLVANGSLARVPVLERIARPPLSPECGDHTGSPLRPAMTAVMMPGRRLERAVERPTEIKRVAIYRMRV
mgnify:CR=1 FL=1